MTRNEFCEKLLECRKSSGVKMKDICFAMNVMPTSIYRMESGGNNFSVNKSIDYLNATKYRMALHRKSTDEIVQIEQYEDLVNWLKKTREKVSSLRALTQQISCANGTIGNIESKKSIMTIDIFLKLAETLEYIIKITPTKS